MRLYRVLFVCIGNSCRSQMAEAFARVHGDDVMMARSAGLSPCEMVAPVTRKVMREKGISLEECVPKGFETTGQQGYDLVINMSGRALPAGFPGEIREWMVEDPIWVSDRRHREIRDQIEALVRRLAEELRGRQTSRNRLGGRPGFDTRAGV